METIHLKEQIHRFSFLNGLAWESSYIGKFPVSGDILYSMADRLGETITLMSGIAVLSSIFEVKITAALCLEELATAYASLLKRLVELNRKPPRRPAVDPVNTSPERWKPLTVTAEILLQPLIEEIQDTICQANRLSDWPTVRLFERTVLPCLNTCVSVIASLQKELAQKTDDLSMMAARDHRYETFNNTRDYRSRSHDYEIGEAENETIDSLLAQIRTQRDELDAIETFARLLAAEERLTPGDILALARIVADEARHTLMGELALSMLNLNPFEIPIGTIGAELRRGLEPWDGLAQICLIGESGNLKAIGMSATDANTVGFLELAGMLQTIYRDEHFHIAAGIRLLLQKHPDTTPADLRLNAFELTNSYLHSRGIAPVTLENAGRLLGE